MAEPSYIPLSPLKPSSEGAISPPLKHFKDDPDLSNTMATGDPVSFSSRLRAPRLFQKGTLPSRPPLWHVIKTPLEMALLPLVAIGYLAFCYTVHGKAVPVNTYGLYAVTPQHFSRSFIPSVLYFMYTTVYAESYSRYQRWCHFHQYHHHLGSTLSDLQHYFRLEGKYDMIYGQSKLLIY